MKKALILSDIHYPHHDKKAINIAHQVGMDIEPDYIVYLGDNIDADGISKYTAKTIERGIYEVGEELDGFKREIHSKFENLANDIYWCGGNHDVQRIDDTLKTLKQKGVEPKLIEHYREVMSIEDRFPDVEVCKYNQYFNIGKLYFTHGTYHNDAHTKKHVTNFGRSIVYAHTHTVQSYTKVSAHDGQHHKGTSLGCLCNLNPDYMKNSPNAWVHAFGVAYFHEGGEFNLYPIEIIKGKAIFNGKLYK